MTAVTQAPRKVIKFPSIERLEKAAYLFTDETRIVVEEKLDGSNFSFYRDDEGRLIFQSRNHILEAPYEKMFTRAVSYVEDRVTKAESRAHNALLSNVIYYGEAMGTGKLKYPDAPPFVLYDIYNSYEDCWNSAGVPVVASLFGMECAPVLYTGPWGGIEHIKSLIGPSQFNPNITMEGVVVKAVNLTGTYTDKETGEPKQFPIPYYMGKIVTDEFKEVSKKTTSITKVDEPLKEIAATFVTPARIHKAIQRELEAGVAEQDIQPHKLIGSINQDIKKEESDTIKDMLMKVYWKPIAAEVAKLVLEQV